MILACVAMCAQRDNKIGALAFGAELPNGKQAFPTSPSWMLYGGDDAHCLDNVPILIRPETFCSVFTAEARVFRCALCWLPAYSYSLAPPLAPVRNPCMAALCFAPCTASKAQCLRQNN